MDILLREMKNQAVCVCVCPVSAISAAQTQPARQEVLFLLHFIIFYRLFIMS